MHPQKNMFSRLVIKLIDLYQATLSPDKSPLFRRWLGGRICAHTPHCSEYGKQCFRRYPFFSALDYTMERVSQCVPQSTKIYDPSSYRVVFFSSAPIGVSFLKQLAADRRFDLVGVVTMPDAPMGRGMKTQENIIKQTATKMLDAHEWLPRESEGVLISTPRSLRLDSKKYAEDARSFREWIQNNTVDMFVVIAYGNILPQDLLDMPTFGSINVHGSLLPAYRGASPLQSVFLDHQSESGVTIMHMDAGVDTGDIIAYKRTHLAVDRTVVTLIDRIKTTIPSFLGDMLWEWAKGRCAAVPQDDQQATLCRKFVKEDGCIDPFQDSFRDIWSKRQAFALRPKLYFFSDGKRITIADLSLDASVRSWEQLGTEPLMMKDQGRWILNPVCGALRLVPEGKKPLSRDAFVHGYLVGSTE